MNSYEQNQIEQIKEWKNEVPSVVSQAVGTILKPVTWVVSLVIPSKAIKGALLGCDKIAEFLTDTNDIKRDANVSAISELAHKKQEPIFITKNGYSDLVVMSAELYERFAQINKIDQAIYEAEKEVEEGAQPISMNSAMERLNQKYYG